MVLSQHNSAYKNVKRLLMKYYQFLRNVSVGRALDCRTGGRGFDSRGRTNTRKVTEKWRYWTFAWLGWSRKMAVPSPLGDVKYSVHNYHFRAKYSDTQINCIFCWGGGGSAGVVVTKRPGVQKVPSSIVGRTWVFSLFSFFFFTFSLLFSYIVLFVD